MPRVFSRIPDEYSDRSISLAGAFERSNTSMRVVTQTLVLIRLGLLGILQRKWSSLVLLGSVACVVGVLLSMLSVTEGMLRAWVRIRSW